MKETNNIQQRIDLRKGIVHIEIPMSVIERKKSVSFTVKLTDTKSDSKRQSVKYDGIEGIWDFGDA